MKIIKAPETMTSRERVLRTFNYEKTDRLTMGYAGNENVNKALQAALGAKNFADVLEMIGVDYYGVEPPYVGPKLFTAPPGRRVHELEGAITRWVEHPSGGYWSRCDFPLKDAEDEAFEAFPVPDPDDFDYDTALERAKDIQGRGYAVFIGKPGIPDIINSSGRIMGMEDALCHLQTGCEPAMRLINRRAQSQLGMLERLLEKCRGYIDFVWLGEDMGTQRGPMVSRELYERAMKPIHRRFAALANSYGLPSMMHTCGSSSWAYEDLIEIGVKGVDSLQPEAADMSPEYLMARFGGRLNFRSLISTAGPLAYGTPAEVDEICQRTIETMNARGGYHFAPSQAVQDNTPAENLVAMYNAGHRYGR